MPMYGYIDRQATRSRGRRDLVVILETAICLCAFSKVMSWNEGKDMVSFHAYWASSSIHEAMQYIKQGIDGGCAPNHLIYGSPKDAEGLRRFHAHRQNKFSPQSGLPDWDFPTMDTMRSPSYVKSTPFSHSPCKLHLK